MIGWYKGEDEREIHHVQAPLNKILKEIDQRLSHKTPAKSRGGLKWGALVGKDLAQYTQVESFNDGLLIVTCYHQNYAQLLLLEKRRIITQIKKEYPTLHIFDLKTKIGPIKNLLVAAKPEQPRVEERQSGERKAFEEILARLRNMSEEHDR